MPQTSARPWLIQSFNSRLVQTSLHVHPSTQFDLIMACIVFIPDLGRLGVRVFSHLTVTGLSRSIYTKYSVW